MINKQDIQSAKDLKQKIEWDISAYIQKKTSELEEQTGLTISSVSVYGIHAQDFMGSSKQYKVSDVDIELEI